MVWKARPTARWLTVLIATAVCPRVAQAQLARPQQPSPDAPKMLVVPFWYDAGDSATSLLVADGLRDRMRTAHLSRFNAISRQNMNENLVASGFPTDAPLEPAVVRQLARFLNARLVVEGRLIRRGASNRNGDSVRVTARMYETAGQAPQTANVEVATTYGRVGSSSGAELANRLVDAFQSFDDVQDCNRSREQGNLQRALQRARDALRQYPNSASAYFCMATVLEAQSAPAESVIAALRNAYERDTMNTLVMRRLASRYQTMGDTVRLVDMLRRILAIDVRDNDLRINTVRMLVGMGRGQDALAVVDQGLSANPASLELLQAKSVALAAAGRWADAATTLQQVGDIDSTAIDSAFVFRITNYYAQIPDSASLYRWTETATRRVPTQAVYWYNLSNLAMNRGDTSRALESARRYVALRPDDGRGHLALGRALLAMGQHDSALAHADLAARDSTLRAFVGPFYLQGGAQALRDTNFTLAAQRLQRAKDWSTGSVRVTAAYYLAVAQIQLVQAGDRAAEASRACDVVRQNLQLLTEAEQNVIAGAAQDRAQANRILSEFIPAFRQRGEAFLRNWRCPPVATSPSPGR